MINDLKETVRQSAIYGIGSVATKLLAIVLFPLYSLRFSVEQYSVIVRAEILWQLLFMAIHFGISIAVFRWLHELRTGEERNALLNSLLLVHSLVGVGIMALTYPFYGTLSMLLLGEPAASSLLFTVEVIAIGEALLFVPLMALRHESRPWFYGLLILVNAGCSSGFQIGVLSSSTPTLAHLYDARAIGPVAALLVAAVDWRKRLPFHVDVRLAKKVFSYSIPIMLVGLLSFLLNSADRYVLAFMGNETEVGWYGLGGNIAGLLGVVFITPFGLVFPPLAWKKKGDANAKRFFTKTMTYAFFVFCFGALGLSLFTPFLIRVFAMNPAYWHAEAIVPLLSLAFVFYGVTTVGTMSYYLEDRTDMALWLFAVVVTFNLIANIVGIHVAGMNGAAAAKVLTFIVHLALIYVFSKRVFYFSYEVRKLITMTVLVSVLWGCTRVFPPMPFAVNVLVRGVLLLLFPVLLAPLGFYEPIERQRIGEISRSIWRRVVRSAE